MHKHTPLPLPYPWPLALSLSHLPRPNPNKNYGYRTEQLGNATRLYLVPVSSFDLYIIGEAKKMVQSRPPHIPTRTPSPGPGPLYPWGPLYRNKNKNETKYPVKNQKRGHASSPDQYLDIQCLNV